MQSQPETRCVITLSLSLQENINIDEAAHCLVKHITANENDLLQSEVADTISPQQESSRRGTCSACFRSWRRSPEGLRGALLHSTSSWLFQVYPSCVFSSHLIHISCCLCLSVSAPETGFHGNKAYRTLCRAENVLRERDSGEKSICRTSRELQVPAESKPQKANAVFNHPFFILLSFYWPALLLIHIFTD